MKYFFSIILFFLSINTSFAQWSVGIEGGLNIAKFSPSNLRDGSELSYKNGIVIGGSINYKFNEYFTIHSGLRYNQRGGKISHNNPGFVGDATKYFDYLEIPVKFIYVPFDIELKPVLIFGTDISYILLAKGEGTINNQRISEDDTGNIDNRIDVFLETGIGIMPALTGELYYSLSVSYYYGVFDIDEYITTSGIHLLVGIYFKL